VHVPVVAALQTVAVRPRWRSVEAEEW